MINFGLAVFVFLIALASEVLQVLEIKKKARMFGFETPTNGTIVRCFGPGFWFRPLLASALVWILARAVS